MIYHYNYISVLTKINSFFIEKRAKESTRIDIFCQILYDNLAEEAWRHNMSKRKGRCGFAALEINILHEIAAILVW
ncbi:MAG: hypothetical protein KBS59_00100, partial [Clostridiales bacterium]|nr:hypothetical protein [Clostridiales bacterium]